MKVPLGGREIEYVALRVNRDVLASDLRNMLDLSGLRINVNGETRAQSSLWILPMEPPMSGRFVFYVHYPTKEGDSVTLTLDSGGFRCEGPLELTAEISILGAIEVENVGT